VARRRGKRSKHLLGDLKETWGYWKLKRGSSLLHSEENSFCERLWNCLKTDYGNNEWNPCKVFLTWRFRHQIFFRTSVSVYQITRSYAQDIIILIT
jgi:hypothetical protein